MYKSSIRKGMKKNIYLVVILIISLSLILPSVSYSWSRGYYRPYGHYRCGGYNNGWAVGAAIVGGILAGAVVGNIIAQSAAYNALPQRVYPAPQTNVAYAYPDPAFIAKYGQKKSPGEWVIVPGQSVDGKWVPEHKVWLAVNP